MWIRLHDNANALIFKPSEHLLTKHLKWATDVQLKSLWQGGLNNNYHLYMIDNILSFINTTKDYFTDPVIVNFNQSLSLFSGLERIKLDPTSRDTTAAGSVSFPRKRAVWTSSQNQRRIRGLPTFWTTLISIPSTASPLSSSKFSSMRILKKESQATSSHSLRF